MSAANTLLQAIHGRLSGDAALMAETTGGVVDRLLPRPVFPCIVFGDLETRDYSTATEQAEEHFLTLEIWSEAGGRKRAEEIAMRVRTLLDDAALTLEGMTLVSLQHRSGRSRREPKARSFVAELCFRAVTE